MAYTKTIFPSFNKDVATGQIIKEKVKTTIKVRPLQPIIFMESMCDEFIGVKLQDKLGNYLIKTNNKSEIDTTHFYLSNNEQKIFVDSSYMGELMTIEYYSIGGFKFSDKLIATQYDESNTVTETLNDIITQGRASIDFYNASGSAIELLENLTTKNTEALATTSSLNTAISNGDIVTIETNITNLQTLTSAQGISISDLNVKADTKQNSTDSALQTTNKNIVGEINELKTSLSNTDTNKQNKSDNTLNTVSKNIVGSINELQNIKSETTHLHDERYYTESEVNELLVNKVGTSWIGSFAKEGHGAEYTNCNAIPTSSGIYYIGGYSDNAPSTSYCMLFQMVRSSADLIQIAVSLDSGYGFSRGKKTGNWSVWRTMALA